MRPLHLLALLSCLMASPAAAQSHQVWVSGTGDDTNSGTRDAPFLTFAAGVAAVLPGGEVDALDPGQNWDSGGTGDWSTLTLSQGVTLDGHTGNAGYHALGSIVVNAGSSDVIILRNLVLDGSISPGTAGVHFNSGGALHIEHCLIRNFVQGGVIFSPANTAQLFVSDTRVENVGVGALSIEPTAAASATLVRSYLQSSGVGLAVAGNSQVTLVDTDLQSNTTGISANAQGSQVDVNMQGGTLQDSSVGVASLANGGTAVVRLSAVTATNLVTPATKSGAAEVITFGNNVAPSDSALCLADGYTLSPSTLPPLRVGVPASFQPAMAQARGGITLSLASGSLPAGMALSGGSLTGTPTQSGHSSFSLTASDARGCSGTSDAYTASIPQADFSLLAVDSVVTTVGTRPVDANLFLMPLDGVLADAISLSCAGAADIACDFSVDSAHLGQSGTPLVVTLTPGTTFAARQNAAGSLMGLVAIGMFIRLRDRQRLRRQLGVLLMLGATACRPGPYSHVTPSNESTGSTSPGGPQGGTQEGSPRSRPDRVTTVTITATSAGQVVRTADVQITVTYPL